MAEYERKEVKVVKVIAKCECGGEFEPTGMKYMTNPPQYPHKCNKCEKKEQFRCTYPKIEYEEVNYEKD